MERRKFVQVCCYSAIGLPILATVLQSCGSVYYAVSTRNANGLIVAKSEFWNVQKNKKDLGKMKDRFSESFNDGDSD